MTKKEFKQKLEEMFYKIGVVQCAEGDKLGYEIREKEGIHWFIIAVYEKKGDVLVRRNIPFYLELTEKPMMKFTDKYYWFLDELPEGNYFFGERMPTSTIPTPREDLFKDIEGIIEQRGKNFAIVKKFVQTDKGVTPKRFFIKKTDTGFEEKEIIE